MSAPIALGGTSSSPSPHLPDRLSERKFERSNTLRIDQGANALSAPTTPSNRLPQVDRAHADPNVVRAAEGMEAMFLDYMMKAMRETIPKNEMDLENSGTEIYRGMLDSEVAQKAVHAGGVGLADQVIAYLQSQQYTLPRGQGVPEGSTKSVSPRTGGTHESQ